MDIVQDDMWYSVIFNKYEIYVRWILYWNVVINYVLMYALTLNPNPIIALFVRYRCDTFSRAETGMLTTLPPPASPPPASPAPCWCWRCCFARSTRWWTLCRVAAVRVWTFSRRLPSVPAAAARLALLAP